MNKILYLGLSLPPSAPVHYVHYPLIATKRLDTPKLEEALALWSRFTHVVFTSRRAVIHWTEKCSQLEGKIVVAIGEGTAKELGKRGISSLLAPEATQEGVIALLQTLDLTKAFLFLPHSQRARPRLVQFLKEKTISFFSLELYETLFQRIEPLPNLNEFGEIIFTSPSTVEAFLLFFGSFPAHCRLTAIGPITARTMENYLRESRHALH